MRTVRRRRTRGEAGFTLLELLVAMTLLGLLAALLAGGLRFGARAWEAGERGAESLARLEAAQGFLRRHLAEAYPVPAPGGEDGGAVAFTGAPDAVAFATLLPPHFGVAGLHWMTVAVDDAGGVRRLVVRWRAFPDGEAGDETVLVERIAGAELAYLGADGWRDRWEDAEALPRLVRLAVSFAPGESRRWPELVVAPRLDVAVGSGP